MKFKVFKIIIISLLFIPSICVAEEFFLPIADAINLERKLSKESQSCIVTNSYRSGVNTDIYYCSETENLEKALPAFSDYPYFTFIFSWYFDKGTTIKDAKVEKKLLSASFKYKSNKNNVLENLSIDDGSKYLWSAIDKYTCFHLDNHMRVSKRLCSK